MPAAVALRHSDCDTKVWPQMAKDAIETAWRCVARISELVKADVPSGRGSSGGVPGPLFIIRMVLDTVSMTLETMVGSQLSATASECVL